MWPFKKKVKEVAVEPETTVTLVIGHRYKLKKLDENPFVSEMYVRVEQIIGDFVQYRYIGPNSNGEYYEGMCTSNRIKIFCEMYE